MNKYIRNIAHAGIALLGITMLVAVALQPETAKAGDAESYIALSNVFGSTTANSSNFVDIAPVPNGFQAIQKKFKVVSGTLTLASDGSTRTTNVTVGGGSGTNSFIAGGTVTFSSSDGWVDALRAPQLDGGARITGYATGSYGGTAVSGLPTGTVNTAVIYYWLTLRL